ncbi:MAG: NapC/NirT family cytochrome c [Ignavibacteriales bacterium]|nr:NapC/NirT family cytochrome c [Ignavibacteriales bacterium]
MKHFVPRSFLNPVSLAGAALAGISFSLIVFLFLLEAFTGHQKPYMGIIAFVILPAVLMLGVVVTIVGMYFEHRRQRKIGEEIKRLPAVDLNNPHHRAVFGFFSAVTVVLLIFSAFGSFQLYEFTESVQFCGEICHAVMKPEYTAYLHSPHARVTCAQWHVGAGTDWYVKSKLSGAYQVYSVIFHKYSQPIETPVRNLRPAQGTCEQCHWPKHFFGQKETSKTYFLSDETNTRWRISLLLKIGGGNAETGLATGIHWHMNINNEITYVSTDRQRQAIPYIRVKNASGKVTEYTSTEVAVTPEMLSKGEERRMDCIDCHNRPTHIYRSPKESVDEVMTLNWIDASLPSAKSIAVDALTQPYATEEGARDSIGLFIRAQYANRYPAVAASRTTAIDSTIAVLQRIYAGNFFPEMRVSWEKYPNNIGHLDNLGCFRCHDGKHVSKEGKVLTRDCSTCHSILAQGDHPIPASFTLQKGMDFVHPVDIGDAWKEMNCSDCHKGK